MAQSEGPDFTVYVGAYTRRGVNPSGKAEGIYVYRLSAATGALEPAGVAPGIANPSFLAVDPAGQYLYAVNEEMDYGGQPGGALSAFTIGGQPGVPVALSHQRTGGAWPCYVSLDAAGQWALVANYAGGSVAVLPLRENGELGPATAVAHHSGHGVDPERQEAPHPHSITLDLSGRYALVPDLGLDRIVVYRFDSGQGSLGPHDPPWAATRPGAGPRHLALHPGGRCIYCSNELDSTVTVYAYDRAAGTLAETQSLAAAPEGSYARNYPAHVLLDPSATHLYVSNRGHDSIAVFAVDAATGRLAPAGHFSSGGHWPRHFAIDPSGRCLLVANQQSDNLAMFTIDPVTGGLTPAGITAVPDPACVLIDRA